MQAGKPVPRIRNLLAIAGVVLSLSVQAADSWTLTASEWSRPRSGATVAGMAPVAAAVRHWQARENTEDARLLLVHPGGEEGSLWAAELRDWLIALGIPPSAIETATGGQASDRLEIRVRG